jgi:hypothetical protein
MPTGMATSGNWKKVPELVGLRLGVAFEPR